MVLRPIGLNVPKAGDWKALGLIQQLELGFSHKGLANTWIGR
jgi:hypothetical protein